MKEVEPFWNHLSFYKLSDLEKARDFWAKKGDSKKAEAFEEAVKRVKEEISFNFNTWRAK